MVYRCKRCARTYEELPADGRCRTITKANIWSFSVTSSGIHPDGVIRERCGGEIVADRQAAPCKSLPQVARLL